MSTSAWSSAAFAALQPRPRISVSEWADRFRVVAAGTSPEPDRWRTSRVPYLREMMDAISDPTVERVVVQAGSQLGKALAIDTPIATPGGWNTMGDLRVGDLVFDEQGAPVRIIAATQVMRGRPCYRVRFSDRSEIVADADHSWYVEADHPLLPGRAHHPGARSGVLTTAQIAERAQWQSGSRRATRNTFAIPAAKPLQLPAVDLPIPPYALGAWLGDGHSYSAQITAAKSDVEICDHLRACGVAAEVVGDNTGGALTIRLSLGERDPSRCKRGHALAVVGMTLAGHCAECSRHYSLRWKNGRPLDPVTRPRSFSEILIGLGLLKGSNPRNVGNAKAIPPAYLRASAEQRMELLRGLMDTDGTVGVNGRCEYVTTSSALADGVIELLVSQGLKPTVVTAQPSCMYKGERVLGNPSWRIGFTAYAEAPVFNLSRKRARLRGREGRRPSETERRRIVAVEQIESVPVRCIQVDSPRHLYLAGRAMIPTHNSELLLNLIGYFADADPSPILLVQPTEIASRAFSKERIEPTFRATPALRGRLSTGLRDKENTIHLHTFPGGYLACAWATSAVSLASRPIRVVLLDEVDRYPDSLGRDGDPIAQAVQRTANFHNRKIVAVSTPTIEGISPIARLYEDTDQRRLHVPCPRCGVFQVLEWSGVIYKGADGQPDLAGVHYRCEHCAGRIEERDRPAMLALGEWQADNPGHLHRGYQLSALYSPWVRWRELAAEWIKATTERDKRGLQEFVNLRLGETWAESSDQVSAEALEKNREEYPAEVPPGALLLTAGVDVQDNRLEIEVVGWGIGKESWGIAYCVVVGDTSTPDPWRRLDELLARTWLREGGGAVGLWCACIDSGGHRTSEVYEFCRARLARNIFAIKGWSGEGRPIVGKPTTSNQLRIPLYPVGADTTKDAVFSRLAIDQPGPGFCHFPTAREAAYDDEFFKGLCSEKRVVKIRGGRRKREWKQLRARNEPLDCRVYATAAMELLVPDFDLLAKRSDAPSAPTRAAPRRRIYSKGIG